MVLSFRDVTAHRRLAQQLSHHATHDALTGLVNRSEFERRIQRGYRATRRIQILGGLHYDYWPGPVAA